MSTITGQVATVSVDVGGQEIVFETGKLAKQAGGACVVTLGETQVLAACTTANPREGIDFFPLTIDVEERMYAAGKIPGGFFRREGRPSETAVLTARLTDRPLRPTFRDGYRDEVQVVITVLSADQANAYDVPAINAASAAVMLAALPFDGPVAAVRMALIGGLWKVNPTYQELDLRANQLAHQLQALGVGPEVLVGLWVELLGAYTRHPDPDSSSRASPHCHPSIPHSHPELARDLLHHAHRGAHRPRSNGNHRQQ